ncbi:MAG: hypothetical protein ABSG13_26835 [Bryobacteraceae bacterium]
MNQRNAPSSKERLQIKQARDGEPTYYAWRTTVDQWAATFALLQSQIEIGGNPDIQGSEGELSGLAQPL